MNSKIVIQGFKGSFHELAAQKFFGENIECIYTASFEKLFRTMEQNDADFAVMAIENSVAGSILPNYARLRDSEIEVFGEVYIHISMNLMALKGQRLSDIKEVHSHPMALLQCSKFFREHHSIRLVESEDTALSAKLIADNKVLERGALAGAHVAEMFDLEILNESIETNPRNFTRFLVLRNKSEHTEENFNKATWSFRANDLPGSLAKVLTLLGDHGINLTKIQSLPVIGEEWRYFFYADLEFESQNLYEQAKKEILPFLFDLKILGEYKQGEKLL